MRPKIGIDCQNILTTDGTGAGIEHCVWHIVQALSRNRERTCDLVLFFNPNMKGTSVTKEFSDYKGVKIEYFPKLAVTRQGWWPYTKYKAMSRFLETFGLDLWHGPANITPLGYKGRTIITVHDLIIYENPQWFPGGISGWFWRSQVVPKAIKKASKVIAVSKFTKEQVHSRFNIDPDDIDVIYEGVTISETQQSSDVLSRNSIKQPYFLYIGTIEPRKNLVRLIKAFALLHRKRPDVSLVIAGKKGWKYEEVFQTVADFNLVSSVIFTGYADNADKFTLHQGAIGFTFPSLAEGFGLPVLDAMQSGLPVLTSKTSSLVEVAGDAALLVDPMSVDDIYSGLSKITTNPSLHDRLVNLGHKQAHKFSWEKAASQTLATYQESLNAN